jgi:hypothetical protein
MRHVFLTLAVAALLLSAVGVGSAAASPPASQGSGQWAGSEQGAGSAAGGAQQEATNANDPVRVLSPGDEGDVSQSNEASSDATAGNHNGTSQSADQTQGGSGLQAVGQSASNDQDALALAFTLQHGASNENQPVRVLSPGDGGDVSQSNDASSDASAGNANGTEQTAEQDQAGSSCCGNDGEQVIGQSADSEQDAAALSATEQEKPSNENITVRVLSPGDDGDVSQSNEASSTAEAGNSNATKQNAEQEQGGTSCKCASGGGEQIIGQSADSEQEAGAVAATKQEKPSNSNITVRVLSPGDGGSVTQSNTASSNASAGNTNWTGQTADQSQAGGHCKCGSGGEQLIGQSADSEQKAGAIATTEQDHPSNSNITVRVLSPGDDGDVTQSNEASSHATAGNLNATKQHATQEQAGGSGLQAIGQSASNDQGAFAVGLTAQKGAKNDNTPVRVLSPGDGGSVTQSNDASSNASAGNANWTGQTASQEQGGTSCKCAGGGEQLIGQFAGSEQEAAAISATVQEKPSNENAPVRVLSHGDDGDVEQSNDASSHATAGNLNATKQSADQTQAGGSGIQAIGQSASNAQDAFALGLTVQQGASNENAPVRVLSHGDGGSVTQSNDASSDAVAANVNWTDQDAGQTQGGTSRPDGHCCGTGIQAIGQLSLNRQGAVSLAATLQGGGSEQPCTCKRGSPFGNSNAPTRVLSHGDDGDVSQSNVASSHSSAINWNVTKQLGTQIQPTPCVCRNPYGIQAIGQKDASSQFALGLAATLQAGSSNEWAPDRKKSPGTNGPRTESDRKAAYGTSGSSTETEQSKMQAGR